MSFLSDTWHGLVDPISNAVDSVVRNPLPLLVTLAGMELGMPPVYAGALGGATGAAANGGNTDAILKGALTGGAMVYVG
jgi:hypothetical protein